MDNEQLKTFIERIEKLNEEVAEMCEIVGTSHDKED